MTGRRDDWLDGLAHRVVAPATEPAPRTPDPAGSEERYSRGKAVKLAIAGAASLSLGLWKAAPALAEDRAHCLARCFDTYEKDLERRIESCALGWFALSGWGGFLGTYYLGPQPVITGGAGLCFMAEYAKTLYQRGKCTDHCQESCRPTQSRSLQVFRGTCEVLPPPKAEPPQVPPPPPTKSGECLNCESVGGICCPPAGEPLCACATPGVPCSEYGCS